ncbi:competence type IV pilus major pilin ComGC [Sporosarcina sp. G11-34]|uniref:competence type IV pilus major pilin ComGC n=1 Tax=Sporosarcina sp. G11-34 TaxID=2849605 RepID=UPI0022A92374|nr:competence type IV pilus major pilin ComGC [Sporosarcina sp. G11-34]MCZ2260079.1 prepilin-type N-terminal cleavage/methylation domain-containing protein [Sporosarcina sp. G11-34]
MKKVNNERGFTLIEMMIVLLIISVLILIAIPNVTKQSKSIDKKGCEAYVSMVQSQVEAYKMDTRSVPTIDELSGEDYFGKEPVCPDGTTISIDADGKVTSG